MSYVLHPPLLDQTGLAEALRWYIQGLTKRSGLGITLEVPPDFERLPREMELVMFRLVQECLTNIHRHSGSKTATIRIARDRESVSLEVQDEGKGIPEQKLSEIQSRGGGVGRGMREGIRHFGGDMRIESNESGTRIVFRFPSAIDSSPQKKRRRGTGGHPADSIRRATLSVRTPGSRRLSGRGQVRGGQN